MDALQKILIKSVQEAPSFKRLLEDLARTKPGRKLGLKGLRTGALGAVVTALETAQKDLPVPAPFVLVVTASNDRAAELYDDLQFFGVDKVFHYPKLQVLPYEQEEPLLEEQVKHLEVLGYLASGGKGAVCATSVEALFYRVAPINILKELLLTVHFGDTVDTEQLSGRLVDLGFERVPTVESRGEFSIRGGIIDIFPLDMDNAIRIDLFGDEIESMRWFDVHTQRSIKGGADIEQVTVIPAREGVLMDRALAGAASEGLIPKLPTLLELLPENSLIVLDSPESFPLMDERFQQLTQRQFAEAWEEDKRTYEPHVLFSNLQEVQKASDRFTQLHHSLILDGTHGHGVTFETTSFETTKPSLEHYVTQIRKRLADDYTVVIVCDNSGQVQRMDEMLRDSVLGAVQWTGEGSHPELKSAAVFEGFRDVVIAMGTLHSGFIFPEAQLYVVTDREIFGRYKRRHVYKKIYKGAPIIDAREIRKGDFVVHIEHGIGRFEGIRTQTVDGRVTDFIELIYADDDKLLVPVEKIAYVQKFSGTEQAAPTLDKLGGKRWTQRRKKSQEQIEKLAKELLELYAKRAMARGYQYGEDSLWQHEFEASFLYTETPDQLRAIQDVKADMAGEKPMDRLVCGDVGYGKTEVAIRAAFKAIQDKKQVALLCPTTILAQQHYNTFRERFADYPFRVEMLSRFRTPAEAKKTLTELAEGKIDMIVGTHMLLSKQTKVPKLGLVIVDEEQRFGVTHKERLKELRANVDFMTLTATPIPRTLYMALSGIRDMSVINTPPADRHPIKTKIIHWDRDQIEEAILRELNRGGQVFFVHNRVQNIHQVAEKVREIVPSARIAIGHGQMNEHELEQVMIDFIDGKYDILVSTTIIESGVDIPNVNTIIVNRADAFGLAQLYQLRGRVGRENRRAYAYLIIPAGQAITEQAVARLAALQEFTELGMGFNIAMRDMEIRGTGNLLGKEQHGTVNSIGFELYCRMLEEAVRDMRGQFGAAELAEERDVEVQWKVSAYIPASFVPVEAQRVMLYKKIAEARSTNEIDEIGSEIRDRYGEVERHVARPGEQKATVRQTEDLPEPVENLLCIAKMRVLGRTAGISKISATPSGFKLHCPKAREVHGKSVSAVIHKGNPKVYTDDPNVLDFHYSDWKSRRQLGEAVNVLSAL